MLSALSRCSRPSSVVKTNARFLTTSRLASGGGGHGREHLRPSGGLIDVEDLPSEFWHEPTQWEHNVGPPSKTVFERGQWWVKGYEKNHHLPNNFPYLGDHKDVPYFPRVKWTLYGNYDYLMNIEHLFFYIPAFLVLSVCMPGFACIYAMDESVDCDMVVKIVGRQWYWVYEVESPTGDDPEEED